MKDLTFCICLGMLDEYTALSLVVFTNTMNYIIEISISATELFDPEIYAICNFVFEWVYLLFITPYKV